MRGKVVDLSSEGWGVVKSETGLVCFVEGAWLGDEIEFEIISSGKFQRGKVLSWIHKSLAHRESPCPHWGLQAPQCGACSWMGIHYKDQLLAKELRLKNILARFKLAPEFQEPIKSSSEFGYRNRVKLTHDNNKIGFQIPMSHEISEIKSCLVAEDWINKKIRDVLKNPPQDREIWIQKLEGDSFAQGNSAMNREMKDGLKKLLEDFNGKTIELFCGEGNFSEILVSVSKKLFAYESNPSAILKFQKKFPQASSYVLDLYSSKALRTLSLNSEAELLVLDPPRSGFKQLGELVKELPKLQKIIYISCDPMTFARDLSGLEGWTFKKLLSFDLFPQTPHIETMGYFERTS